MLEILPCQNDQCDYRHLCSSATSNCSWLHIRRTCEHRGLRYWLCSLSPRRLLPLGWPSSRTDATWVWNPAGIPCGLPWVYRRSALLARPNLNRRRQARPRSFPSRWSSMFFYQRFPKSLPTMSYNSSPVFRSTAWSIGRPRPRQPPIQQKSLLPFDESLSLLSPASETLFSRIRTRTFYHGVGSIDGKLTQPPQHPLTTKNGAENILPSHKQ